MGGGVPHLGIKYMAVGWLGPGPGLRSGMKLQLSPTASASAISPTASAPSLLGPANTTTVAASGLGQVQTKHVLHAMPWSKDGACSSRGWVSGREKAGEQRLWGGKQEARGLRLPESGRGAETLGQQAQGGQVSREE